MRIVNEIKLDFKDVLILPKRSTLTSRKEVNLEKTYKFRNTDFTWTGVPIIAANMDGVGTFEMADSLSSNRWITALTKHYLPLEYVAYFKNAPLNNNDYVAYSIGITEEDLIKFENVKSQLPAGTIKFVCIDVANGYTQTFVSFCKKFKQNNPEVVIIAGNVVTPEITEELILNGVDLVKVGIGPGSVCTTRKQTGVGYPQLSAIIECADAAHGLGGHIIGDGGCTCPGDVAKAFGANADFVMLGGMLAGHDEGGGDIVKHFISMGEYAEDDLGMVSNTPLVSVKKTVRFYGMSSSTAMLKHKGEMANYRSSEGKDVDVLYRGPVQKTVEDIMGGLRSSCTYVGARSLKELPKRTTFIRVTQQLNTVFNTGD
jgi:GMP reductase